MSVSPIKEVVLKQLDGRIPQGNGLNPSMIDLEGIALDALTSLGSDLANSEEGILKGGKRSFQEIGKEVPEAGPLSSKKQKDLQREDEFPVFEGNVPLEFRGFCTVKLHDGGVYNGQIHNCKCHGYGIFHFASGRIYKGQFQNNEFHGYGKFYFAEGCEYQGQFQLGHINGVGRVTYSNGRFYEGQFQNNLPHGIGKGSLADRSIFQGEWTEGKPTGQGILTSPDGKAAYVKWENGTFTEIQPPIVPKQAT